MALKDWCNEVGSTKDTQQKVRTLVYGETGMGKTMFAGTWPNPFFINADKGLRTLKNFDYPFIAINRKDAAENKVFTKVLDILIAFERGVFPEGLEGVFKSSETLVIDSISVIGELLMTEAMKYPAPGKLSVNRLASKPEWDHYDVVGSRLDEIVRRALDLNINLVITAGVKLERDDVTGGYIGRPDLIGGYRNKIGHAFDDFLYFASEGNGEAVKYFAYTKPYRYFAAKSRDGLPYKILDPTYEKLYATSLTTK